MINRAMDHFQKTLQDYELAPAFHQTASVHLLRARYQFINGKDPSSQLAQAQEINAHLELASIYLSRKQVERGIEKTVQAEKIDAQHPEALAIRAKLLLLKSVATKDAVLAN